LIDLRHSLPRLNGRKEIISDGAEPVGRFDRTSKSSGRISPVPHPLLFLISTSLTVNLNMKNCTETLEIGSLAPYFALQAANRVGTFTLDGLLADGKLILEFLRGTW
jgi:hypothetical protein